MDGRKRVEVRHNDRDYRYGDTLCLHEWDPATEDYTGRETRVIVTWLMQGKQSSVLNDIPRSTVVMSFWRPADTHEGETSPPVSGECDGCTEAEMQLARAVELLTSLHSNIEQGVFGKHHHCSEYCEIREFLLDHDFYEEDEPVEDVVKAFEMSPQKGITIHPGDNYPENRTATTDAYRSFPKNPSYGQRYRSLDGVVHEYRGRGAGWEQVKTAPPHLHDAGCVDMGQHVVEITTLRDALYNLVHNIEWLVERDPSPSPKAALMRAKDVLFAFPTRPVGSAPPGNCSRCGNSLSVCRCELPPADNPERGQS